MGKETAVVYYSKNGNTRLTAKIVAEKTQGTLIELKEKRRGTPMHALMKIGSALKGTPWAEIGDAQKVYLLLPIWAGNASPAMNAFVKRADFSGKDVCIITLQADPDAKSSPKVTGRLAELVKKKNATVFGCYGLVGELMGKCKSEENLRAQIEKAGIGR